MSFSAGELAASIREHISNFRITYRRDYRLEEMTKDMLEKLTKRHAEGKLYR